jgi:probable rRNA maturation factor
MEDAETSSDSPDRSPRRDTALDVDVVDESRGLTPADAARLRDAARHAARHLGCTGEIRVRVVGDEAMAAAHERWAGVPGTTDVLTFDLGSAGRRLDLDALVCLDEAARQAGPRGHEAWRELLLYVVHAVLHCLGHDDHDPDRAAEMHRLEDETLEAIGVGRTYAACDGETTP